MDKIGRGSIAVVILGILITILFLMNLQLGRLEDKMEVFEQKIQTQERLTTEQSATIEYLLDDKLKGGPS